MAGDVGMRQSGHGRRSWWPTLVGLITCTGQCTLVAAKENTEYSVPSWAFQPELEDFDCRAPIAEPVVNWEDLRSRLRELVERMLDPSRLELVKEDAAALEWRRRAQFEILRLAAVVLLDFQRAVDQCPLGTVAASLYGALLAHLPKSDLTEQDEQLPMPFEIVLGDLRGQTFANVFVRDFRFLLDVAPVHVLAASDWAIFGLVHAYLGKLQPGTNVVDPAVLKAAVGGTACLGTSVAGYTSERIRLLLRQHIGYASGRDIEGLKFLRGLDVLITAVMKDPREFSLEYLHTCPAGAAAFGAAASMLALMSNPSLFERFAHLSHYVFKNHVEAVLGGALSWGLFHALAKLSIFAIRDYDLVWSNKELMPLPSQGSSFDALRLDKKQRLSRLAEVGKNHVHKLTRDLAQYFWRAGQEQPSGLAQVTYVTAVGGQPFSDYIEGFVRRAKAVGLPSLVVACMDPEAFSRCQAAGKANRWEMLHCVAAFEGHVIFIKHAFLPTALSAAVDTVWLDFDTYLVKDPTPSLRAALARGDAPHSEVRPRRNRIRFGSFLFDNETDVCTLTKICDSRMHWSYQVVGDWDQWDFPQGCPEAGCPSKYEKPRWGEAGAGKAPPIDLLVTEHWDARCLNNGLYYIRASHRTLSFFVAFLRQLYANPYTDNQNLFDSFLAHSTIDSCVPESRPILRYDLLDIEHTFACAEGHMVTEAEELATFHFWSSDFRTREAAEGEEDVEVPAEAGPGRITMRDGIARVPKTRASKAELFELFLGSSRVTESSAVPREAAAFIEKVKAPKPNWKGMCAVTAVGIEDLVDERMLQGEQRLIDWNHAAKAEEVNGDALLRDEVALEVARLEQESAGEDDAACSAKVPRCRGVSLDEWVDALRVLGDFEAQTDLLTAEEISALKARIRSLDVGVLITLRAFALSGPKRLAQELKGILKH